MSDGPSHERSLGFPVVRSDFVPCPQGRCQKGRVLREQLWDQLSTCCLLASGVADIFQSSIFPRLEDSGLERRRWRTTLFRLGCVGWSWQGGVLCLCFISAFMVACMAVALVDAVGVFRSILANPSKPSRRHHGSIREHLPDDQCLKQEACVMH